MAQHFNLYFCLRNFSYDEVVLCSSYFHVKNPFSLLKAICFSLCKPSVINCLFDFSILLSFLEFQLSLQLLLLFFLPSITLFLSDRRASDETITKKEVKSALYGNVRGKGAWKTETSDKAKWCEPSPPSNSNFSVSHVNLHVIAKAGNRAKLRSPLTP